MSAVHGGGCIMLASWGAGYRGRGNLFALWVYGDKSNSICASMIHSVHACTRCCHMPTGHLFSLWHLQSQGSPALISSLHTASVVWNMDNSMGNSCFCVSIFDREELTGSGIFMRHHHPSFAFRYIRRFALKFQRVPSPDHDVIFIILSVFIRMQEVTLWHSLTTVTTTK